MREVKPPRGVDYFAAMLAILDRFLAPDFPLTPEQRAKVQEMKDEALRQARYVVRAQCEAERRAPWLN